MTATTLAKKAEGALADPTTTTKPERRRELDRIGPLIVMGLVVAHTLTIFAGRDIIIDKSGSEVTALVAGSLVSFPVLWAMPLMMFIAGMTIRYSLRKRTVGEFVWERTKRLFVPFYTGLVLAIPPMVYFKAKEASGYARSFIEFYPRFWQVKFSLSAWPLFVESGTSDWVFYIAHLWFVLYLFVFTLLLLPLLLTLRRTAGRRVVERLAKILARPWAILLLALPIATIEAFPTTERPGAWNRLVWPIFLLYGFVFAADARFDQAVRRLRISALVLGVLGFFALMGVSMVPTRAGVDWMTDYGLVSVLCRLLHGMSGWFWIFAIVGLAGHAFHKRSTDPRQISTYWASLGDTG
jgi:glucan biosynthesis protein C